MKTAFYTVAIVCTIALSVAALVFLGRLTRAASDLDEQVLAAGQVIAEARTAIGAVSNAATELSGVIKQEREAQSRQTTEANKILAHASDILGHTDLALNGRDGKGGLLPDARTVVLAVGVDAEKLLAVANASLEQLTVAGNATLDGATVSFDTLRTRMNDQRLDEILGNVQSTTYELAGTTADIHTELHRFVYPPPRKWWQRDITDPLKFAAHLVTIPLR